MLHCYISNEGVSMKIKKLCGLKKDEIAKHSKKIIKIVAKPQFICEKCARVAKNEKHLCHPCALKKF